MPPKKRAQSQDEQSQTFIKAVSDLIAKDGFDTEKADRVLDGLIKTSANKTKPK